MGLGSPPIQFNIILESSPLKSRILVWRLGVPQPTLPHRTGPHGTRFVPANWSLVSSSYQLVRTYTLLAGRLTLQSGMIGCQLTWCGIDYNEYGQFSEFHVCFCGLDSGNLKFETVRTNKQHICF